MKTSFFFNILTVSLSVLCHLSMAQTVPTFGAAETFALYTSAGEFANTGVTLVTGDIGNGTGAVTGDAVTLVGQSHFGDTQGVAAAADVAAAYSVLTSGTLNPCGFPLAATLNGVTVLAPGVHCSTEATSFSGSLVLDGGSDPDAVFIIKIGGAFSVDAPANIVLTGGTLPKNVYWVVNGAFNLAGDIDFLGTVVNEGAISLGAGASIIGRAFSTAGKISLNSNVVSNTEVSLPVTLVSFDVKKGEQSSVTLIWATTAETNSDRFEIQRSQNGKQWIAVGSVISNGESTKLLSYSFSDIAPKTGNNLYRLKMIDKDGTFAFSRIRSINFQSANRTALYPNPAIDHLSVLSKDLDKIARVQFMDVSGKLVLDQKNNDSSNAISEFNINYFPAGLYIVKVIFADGSVDRAKILKK